MPVTVATWNLQGSTGVDVDRVAEFLRGSGADVVFLQEVQRKQAHDISNAIGVASLAWGFKHWPVRGRSEGMAVIGVETAVPVATRPITHRHRYWSWRRRIMQRARFAVDGVAVTAVNVHLSPHDASDARRREVEDILGFVADVRRALVVGDLNDQSDGAALQCLSAAGLHDAWDTAGSRSGWAETNWSGRRDAAPDQRLDYVFHGDALCVAHASGASPTRADDWSAWASLSDHVPLCVAVSAAPMS